MLVTKKAARATHGGLKTRILIIFVNSWYTRLTIFVNSWYTMNFGIHGLFKSSQNSSIITLLQDLQLSYIYHLQSNFLEQHATPPLPSPILEAQFERCSWNCSQFISHICNDVLYHILHMSQNFKIISLINILSDEVNS
jgi:hypothetical protein